MHRIAFRSSHVQSKIPRQAWSISATRATWHPQRQPSVLCQRQFHVSSLKQVLSEKYNELSEWASSSNLVEVVQSIPPSHFVALSLVAVLPQILRLGFDAWASNKIESRSSAATPLIAVYNAILSRRFNTILKANPSTKVSKEQLDKLQQLRSKFQNNIIGKYGQSYSAWERKRLYPPNLHLGWTIFVFLSLHLTDKSAILQYCDINALSQITMDSTVGHAIHFASFLVLMGVFAHHVKSNIFLQTCTQFYVNQMRPLLKYYYGFSYGSKKQSASGNAVSAWPNVFTNPLSWSLPREAIDRGGGWSDVAKAIYRQGIDEHFFFYWPLVWLTGFAILWPASVTQAVYLLMVYMTARVRNSTFERYLRRSYRKRKQNKAKWAPLNSRCTK